MRGWKYTRLVGKDTIFLFFQAGYVHLPRFQTEVLAQYARKCTFLMSSRNERSPPAAFALAACTISVKDGHAIDARQVFAINKRNEKTQTIREQSHSLDPKRLHHLYRCISLRGKRFSVGSSVQCVSRSTATMHLHLLLPPWERCHLHGLHCRWNLRVEGGVEGAAPRRLKQKRVQEAQGEQEELGVQEEQEEQGVQEELGVQEFQEVREVQEAQEEDVLWQAAVAEEGEKQQTLKRGRLIGGE
jgi:hypothetical protein